MPTLPASSNVAPLLGSGSPVIGPSLTAVESAGAMRISPGIAEQRSAAALRGLAPAAEAEALPPATATPAERRQLEARVTRATEFQKFVFEASGQMLPLYGYGLFGSERFASPPNAPAPADYLIGPGDEIHLQVWGAIDAELRMKVDRNGQVSVPRVGTIVVAGVPASQLESVLRTRIARIYSNFQLSATLGPLRSIQIFVVGQARQPGTYLVPGSSTLLSALFETGGPAATGSLRAVQLRRDGRHVATLDLYRFISNGEKAEDLRLLAGDVIVIPHAGPRVAVLGAVDSPAIYELKAPQETLTDLLSYAGGTLAITSPHRVQLERIDAAAPRAQRMVEERALDAQGLRSTVRDGDVLTLFRISPEFANAVTLRGNVASPLRYSHRPGMRVSDLIPEREALIQSDYYRSKNMMVQFESGTKVGEARVAREVRNLLEEVNWDYALIERLDPKAVRSQLIPFNLGRAVLERNPVDDLELLPGDVVTIFGVNDVPVPVEKRTQFVRLGGEVKVPGLYQIQPGERLPSLLARAGGLTSNAFFYGTEFVREATRQEQQENLNLAIRRFESDTLSYASTQLQNAQDSEKIAHTQANVAAQQQMLARLKLLKASGRIALDLDPLSPAVPDIVLEDGDSIRVPYRPSFVGVFGAVLSERSFLFKDDYLLRDYLRRAGLTRGADTDAIMIIRADGTVESDAHRADGLFSFGSDMEKRRIFAGDSIFVPEKLDRETFYSRFIRGAKDWTTIFYQFGLGAAGLKTLRQ